MSAPAASRSLRSLFQPFSSAAKRWGALYNDVAARHPMSTGIWTTVVKTSVADLFAQKVVERREEVDWRRHGMFCMFGFAYLGMWQYYLYNNLFTKWCAAITRVGGHRASAPVKVFIDQFIHHPFMYFPCFYIIKGAMEGRTIAHSLSKYGDDMWDNLKACWMVWVPAQMINFTVVPRHLRIPFVAATSFIWTVIISVMRGALDAPTASAAAPQASGQPGAVAQTAAAAAVAVAAVAAVSGAAAASGSSSAASVAASAAGRAKSAGVA